MAWKFEALHKSLGFPKRNRPVLDPAAPVSKTTGGGAVANHQGIGTHAGKGIRDGFLQRIDGGQNANQGSDSNPDNTRGKGGPKAITPHRLQGYSEIIRPPEGGRGRFDHRNHVSWPQYRSCTAFVLNFANP